ncbi:MAG: hypothetical protein SGARI_003956 [Bacillariaceae sp.]
MVMMMNTNNQNAFLQQALAGSSAPAGNDSLGSSNNSASNNNNNTGVDNANVDANDGNNPVASFLRGGPGGNPLTMQAMMNAGAAGGGAGNVASMGSMLSASAVMNNASQAGGAPGAQQNPMLNMNSINFEQIKRLQQMAQLQQQANIMPSQQQQDASTALLQTFLDQKIQTSRFGDLGGMGGLHGLQGQNPMLGAAGTNLLMINPNGSRRMRGGVIEPFPEKLHRLLLEVEAAGRGDVISFVAGGRAFAIHKPEKFFKEIVPLYFRQSRLSSFKRQLNLYGFELINTGPARGGYYHELFVKERPELCRRMRRVAVKVTPKNVDPSDASKDKKKASSPSPSTEKPQDKEDQQEEDDTSEVNSPEIPA